MLLLAPGGTTRAAVPPPAPQGLQAGHLRCEYQADPRGIDAAASAPELAGAVGHAGQRQTAYRDTGRRQPGGADRGPGRLWDSGKVASDRSVGDRVRGRGPGSGQRCWWKVRVWDKDGKPSPDEPGRLLADGPAPARRTGARSGSARRRRAIPRSTDITLPPCPYLRRTFTLAKPVKRATLYATARGLYELHVNGAKVGDAVFAPGWTDYRKRIAVPDLRRDGGGCAGRERPRRGARRRLVQRLCRLRAPARSLRRPPAAPAQLVVEYADGSRQTVVTDGVLARRDRADLPLGLVAGRDL